MNNMHNRNTSETPRRNADEPKCFGRLDLVPDEKLEGAILTVSFVADLSDAERQELRGLLERCCPALLEDLSFCLDDGPKAWE